MSKLSSVRASFIPPATLPQREEVAKSYKCICKQSLKWHKYSYWSGFVIRKAILTLDMRIMNLTTKLLIPLILSSRSRLSRKTHGLRKTEASQDCNCRSKKFMKWWISNHEGSLTPQLLQQIIISTVNRYKNYKWPSVARSKMHGCILYHVATLYTHGLILELCLQLTRTGEFTCTSQKYRFLH